MCQNRCPVYHSLYSTTTPPYPICTTIFSQENYDYNTGGYLTIMTNEDNSHFQYLPHVNKNPPKHCPNQCTEINNKLSNVNILKRGTAPTDDVRKSYSRFDGEVYDGIHNNVGLLCCTIR